MGAIKVNVIKSKEEMEFGVLLIGLNFTRKPMLMAIQLIL